MEILMLLVFGAVAGWIASILLHRDSDFGLFGNIVLGIVGAFIGGFIMNTFGQPGVTGFNFYSIIVAVIGAALLVWLSGFVSRGR